MTLTPDELQRLAQASGFAVGSLEKVLRLLALLDAIRAHPYLGSRVALKGGTALNLFLLDVPRLSVDIDLNYIGAADRASMLADRDPLEQALRAVCGRLDLTVRRVPAEPAGGKWRLSYRAADGGTGTIEVDLNFVLRTPLWPVAVREARPLAPGAAVTRFAVLDPHELAAGKLAALLARDASRDLFDARELLRRDDLDPAKLRLAFVVYGGLNRVDWRTIEASHATTTAADVARQLVPMLRRTWPRRGATSVVGSAVVRRRWTRSRRRSLEARIVQDFLAPASRGVEGLMTPPLRICERRRFATGPRRGSPPNGAGRPGGSRRR